MDFTPDYSVIFRAKLELFHKTIAIVLVLIDLLPSILIIHNKKQKLPVRISPSDRDKILKYQYVHFSQASGFSFTARKQALEERSVLKYVSTAEVCG